MKQEKITFKVFLHKQLTFVNLFPYIAFGKNAYENLLIMLGFWKWEIMFVIIKR